ncbi:helix-turn-helix domain-containing protein [Aquimarina longa]|uniref:helix-turn-helix domain-containing protein n=1 Tax=Aquimarina longa TaxID=1080221 RepID=UPI00078493A9|nr:helix-turn-helix domain-containing protein [Aquimarina longa]
MFNTEMHVSTFVILVLQSLVLFSQLLFFLSRPNDNSRLRFLILTITYILYNLFSGIFPDNRFSLSIYYQNIVAYLVGIIVAVYFIYYIYKEFNIYPFKHFRVRTLFLVLIVSFISFFIVPYYFTENLSLSRKLFIITPLFVSFAFFYQVGKELIEIYKTSSYQNDKNRYYKTRILAGYLGLFSLSLMPVIVAIGDYQSIEQPIVNSGYMIMTVTYIIDLVYKSRIESKVLFNLNQKLTDTKNNKNFKIPEEVTQKILDDLKKFEAKELFLKNDINIRSLSKKINTNTKYLSKTINDYKNRNFNGYINKLRIDYTIKILNENPKLRNYTIVHLSQEVGFNNAEAFSRAFHNVTGKKPSVYIKELLAEKA